MGAKPRSHASMRPLDPLRCVAVCVIVTAVRGATAAPAMAESPPAQRMLLGSLAVADPVYDGVAGLLAARPAGGPRGTHGVRGSIWYAAGLMQRDNPGDRARALHVIDAVLAQQIRQPGAPWDGTFRRTAEDTAPPPGAKMWTDYDPNWREFIGTTLALLLTNFADQIPAPQREQMLLTIECAVNGELNQKRLLPTYTNIALMHAFLWGYAGQQLKRDEWVRGAAAWTETVATRFNLNESFDEFNSPTYYGVDLYGLALLRRYGATPRMREMGAHMEAALWRDIARFYHPRLRNLCGPFDRAYGMDMRHYASLVGEWLALELPAEQAPFPALDEPMDHGGDFLCTPTYVLVGTKIPGDALAAFTRFDGERQFRRPIADGQRVATAWLGATLAIGAEATGGKRGVPEPTSQFHPATIHWLIANNDVGWIALRECPPVDATAAPNQLTVHATGDSVFHINAAGAKTSQVKRGEWVLPGLRVTVDTDATHAEVSEKDGGIEITYYHATSIVLHTQP
jgi:hypothetical protein